jgi:hypothetical protein
MAVVEAAGLIITARELISATPKKSAREPHRRKTGPPCPVALLTLETSPGNFQAWLALAGDEDKEFSSRVRKGSEADISASGATRVAGGINWKDKYAPNLPRVEIREAHHGRMTTAAELGEVGACGGTGRIQAVACLPFPLNPRQQPQMARLWPLSGRRTDQQRRHWPRHEPGPYRLVHDGDHMGFGVEETAQQLMQEPDSKAHMRGEHYAETTARKASLYVHQRKRQPRERIAR